MDCIFCKIAKKEIPSYVIMETENSMAFLDVFPVSRGHTLIIPKNHHEKVQDMEESDSADLFNTVRNVISKVDKITGSTLLAVHNGKESGQEIPHVHVHIIPRYSKTGTLWLKRKILKDNELDELAQKIRNCIE